MKCHCGKIIQSIMRMFCAGFNLYGQFLNIKDQCIQEFTCIKYNNVDDVRINHASLILKRAICDENNSITKTKIYIDGFQNNKNHQHRELNFDSNIIQIAVSDHKLLFLSKEGRVYSISNNTNSECDMRLLSDFTQTEVNEEVKTEFIKNISSGACMSIAYSNLNFIYNIPIKLPCELVDIVDICNGREHCLTLTKDGSVYSFGGNSRGQLGLDDIEDKQLPERISSLEDIKIVKIACGAWHSAAVTVEGDLYTWGWNSNGQLGLQADAHSGSIVSCPTLVDLDENITDVCCGSRHTVILTDNLKMYGCGWNKYYQLGDKTKEENNFQFNFLYDFSKFNVSGLRCGSWNTVILVCD